MTQPGRTFSVLIVDDEENICDAVTRALEQSGIHIEKAGAAEEALLFLNKKDYDLVLCDIHLPGMDGLALLDRLHADHPSTRVIMITGYATVETAVRALKQGAYDYLMKPFSPEEIRQAVKRALENRRLETENTVLREVVERIQGRDIYTGKSLAMRRLFEEADRVAATNASVVITGESGSGKEIVARYLHAKSQRARGPFIAVNCAAIPAELADSEIFGHVKGAFTSAVSDRRGSLELAHGGTLFLDELSELKLEIQAKLLRVVEEQKLRRVGSEQETPVDVRFLTAMQKPPEELIREGKLREDLHFRLGVVHLSVPPLRERTEDIPDLAHYFLRFFCGELKKDIPHFEPETLDLFKAYPWPGNVREMRNVVERAVIFAPPGKPISPAHLSEKIRYAPDSKGTPFILYPGKSMTLEELEKSYIQYVLALHDGNKAQASRVLGISPSTLWRRKEGTEPPDAPARKQKN